jgi:beta-1,4-mannosyltransferase
MIRFTVFPRLHILPHQKANPYIRDFVAALEQENVSKVVNPPHKNPLFSLLPPKRWGDVFIFNWFESIPDFKYGPLQSIMIPTMPETASPLMLAMVFCLTIRLRNK